MKLSSILALLTLTVFTSVAHADYNVINCDSIRGTDHVMTLIVVNQDLKQVRVETTGNRPRPYIPTKVANQNVEGITLYALGEVAGLMEVDNQVLEGNGGQVRLLNDVFSCM